MHYNQVILGSGDAITLSDMRRNLGGVITIDDVSLARYVVRNMHVTALFIRHLYVHVLFRPNSITARAEIALRQIIRHHDPDRLALDSFDKDWTTKILSGHALPTLAPTSAAGRTGPDLAVTQMSATPRPAEMMLASLRDRDSDCLPELG